MLKRRMIGVIAGLLMAAGVSVANKAEAAGPDVDPAIALALDAGDVAYARHNREHRMQEIQNNLDRQQRGGRAGPPPGYGPRRAGPPPGYEQRRAGPPPGYGRRDDGYRRRGDGYRGRDDGYRRRDYDRPRRYYD